MGNYIDFANAILINEKILKREPRVNYSLRKYKKVDSYENSERHKRTFYPSLVNGFLR